MTPVAMPSLLPENQEDMTICLLSELRPLDLVVSAALQLRWHLRLDLQRLTVSLLELLSCRLLDPEGHQHPEETLRLEGGVDSGETLLSVAEDHLEHRCVVAGEV